MMTGDWRDREVIIAEEVFVLWPVLSSGSAGQGKAEGLFPGGLPECPEAESPAGVGGEVADPENLSFLLRDEDRRDPICPNSESRFQKSF